MYQIDYYTAFKDLHDGDIFFINGQGPFRKLNDTQFAPVTTVHTLPETQLGITVEVPKQD